MFDNVPKGVTKAKLTNPFAALKAFQEANPTPPRPAQNTPAQTPEFDLSGYNVPAMGAEGYSVQGTVEKIERDDPRFATKESRTALVMAARKRRPLLASGFDEAEPITAPPPVSAQPKEPARAPKSEPVDERQLSLFDEPVSPKEGTEQSAQTQEPGAPKKDAEGTVSDAVVEGGETGAGDLSPTEISLPPDSLVRQTPPSPGVSSSGQSQAAEEKPRVNLPVLGQHPPRNKKATEYSELQEAEVAALLDLTGVSCNACPLMDGKCEHAKEDATCFYERSLEGLSSRDAENLVPALEMVADLQAKRARRGVLIEARSSGGLVDPGVTRQLEVAAQALLRVREVKAQLAAPPPPTSSFSLAVSATGPAQGGGGLLAKLMSGFGPPPLPEGDTRAALPSPPEVVEAQGELVESKVS